MRPRVILADDHVMVAEGLGHLISRVADLVAQVFDGRQLVDAARRLEPDIIVSDITMPEMSGLEAMRRLKTDKIGSKFIFLTIHTEPRLAAEAMRAGARGYLLKQAAGEELLEAIRTVMAGRTYLTPLITADVLWTIAQNSNDDHALTPRQLDVLRLVAQGKRMKEIAADLGLSVRTVEDHKAHLLETLGVETTADLVKFAVKQGLIAE
ncbi:MAG TPA: response regulator transcription factor [Vicinamibacterales bacterium]|nr:response regulator transcription factor [Vicinamibacterales bacterium]